MTRNTSFTMVRIAAACRHGLMRAVRAVGCGKMHHSCFFEETSLELGHLP